MYMYMYMYMYIYTTYNLLDGHASTCNIQKTRRYQSNYSPYLYI